MNVLRCHDQDHLVSIYGNSSIQLWRFLAPVGHEAELFDVADANLPHIHQVDAFVVAFCWFQLFIWVDVPLFSFWEWEVTFNSNWIIVFFINHLLLLTNKLYIKCYHGNWYITGTSLTRMNIQGCGCDKKKFKANTIPWTSSYLIIMLYIPRYGNIWKYKVSMKYLVIFVHCWFLAQFQSHFEFYVTDSTG